MKMFRSIWQHISWCFFQLPPAPPKPVITPRWIIPTSTVRYSLCIYLLNKLGVHTDTCLLFCPHSPITCWIVNVFACVFNCIQVSPLVLILVIQALAVRYSSVTVLLSFLFISFDLQPPGIFTNGLLDLEPPAKVNPLPPAEGGPALTHALPHLTHTRNTVSTRWNSLEAKAVLTVKISFAICWPLLIAHETARPLQTSCNCTKL